MGVDLFSINLDKVPHQYSPGELVSGKVYLRVSDVETTSEITIRFFGSADNHWQESERHERRSTFHRNSHGHMTEYETVYYNYDAHEILFDFAIRLFGDGNTRYQIPNGETVFTFGFTVPLRPLPVSCNFENGHVVYGLEGRIRKPWYSFDPKTEILPVVLYTMVDLNITPGAGMPMSIMEAKAFSSCCTPSGTCLLRSFTPKLGYCPGEQVPFVVEIENSSNRLVYNLSATLTQLWSLFADGHRGRHVRTHPITLQVAVHPDVGPGTKTRWDTCFTIPPTVPPTPNPGACNITKLEYMIQIHADSEGTCGNDGFGLSHPLVVGTVPLILSSVVSLETPKYNETGGLA